MTSEDKTTQSPKYFSVKIPSDSNQEININDLKPRAGKEKEDQAAIAAILELEKTYPYPKAKAQVKALMSQLGYSEESYSIETESNASYSYQNVIPKREGQKGALAGGVLGGIGAGITAIHAKMDETAALNTAAQRAQSRSDLPPEALYVILVISAVIAGAALGYYLKNKQSQQEFEDIAVKNEAYKGTGMVAGKKDL